MSVDFLFLPRLCGVLAAGDFLADLGVDFALLFDPASVVWLLFWS